MEAVIPITAIVVAFTILLLTDRPYSLCMGKSYVVQQNDTFRSIAAEHNVRQSVLTACNLGVYWQTGYNKLTPGMSIRIQEGILMTTWLIYFWGSIIIGAVNWLTSEGKNKQWVTGMRIPLPMMMMLWLFLSKSKYPWCLGGTMRPAGALESIPAKICGIGGHTPGELAHFPSIFWLVIFVGAFFALLGSLSIDRVDQRIS